MVNRKQIYSRYWLQNKAIIKSALKSQRNQSDAIFNKINAFGVRRLYVCWARFIIIYYIIRNIFENSGHGHNTRLAENLWIHNTHAIITKNFFHNMLLYCGALRISKFACKFEAIFHLFSKTNYKLKMKNWSREQGKDKTEWLITSIYRLWRWLRPVHMNGSERIRTK